MNTLIKRSGLALAIAGVCLSAGMAQASSHREAPFITELPKVDGTDFYMFRSYETGREGFVTLIANYLPLQDAYGGPNYFDLDEDAIYEIHIDNTGDAVEDLTFQFQFKDVVQDLKLTIGDKMVSVPLKNIAPISNASDDANIQVRQEYTLKVIRGDRRTGTVQAAMNLDTGTEFFAKPLDNIGGKSFPTPGYEAYANEHIFNVSIPDCPMDGKVFVGQRKEAFAVNLGEIFDLVNTDPLGPRNAETNDLADKNVTSFALEVPTVCLTGSAVTNGESPAPVIGAWTTASVRQARVINPMPGTNGKGATVEGGAFTQVSRLGMPLVNEVVIGLKDKDLFNASEPKDDGQFATYVTNPTLPVLLEMLFRGTAVAPEVPRNDLVTAFLTGVPGINGPTGVVPSEMLRLNTSIDPVSRLDQNDLGIVTPDPMNADVAGFPNGRRPIDDVVDIALRVVMGYLIDGAPNQDAPLTDGVQVNRAELLDVFPYLAAPIPGSVTP